MSTASARTVPLLTVFLLALTANPAHAQELDPEWELQADEQVGGSPAADTAVRDAGVGGSSAHSTVAGTGGAARNGGTIEMAGPDMNSCACRMFNRQCSKSGVALLMLAAVGALARVRSRVAKRERCVR